MSKEDLIAKLIELANAKKEAIDAGNIEKARMISEIEKKIEEEIQSLNDN